MNFSFLPNPTIPGSQRWEDSRLSVDCLLTQSASKTTQDNSIHKQLARGRHHLTRPVAGAMSMAVMGRAWMAISNVLFPDRMSKKTIFPLAKPPMAKDSHAARQKQGMPLEEKEGGR